MTWPRSQAGFLGRLGKGNARCTPPCSKPSRVPPGMGTPPPSKPPLRGAGPVWSPLLPHLSPPTSYPVTWGFLPGVKVPHQHPAGSRVVGRHEFHIFPHRYLDSTPQEVYFLYITLKSAEPPHFWNLKNTRSWMKTNGIKMVLLNSCLGELHIFTTVNGCASMKYIDNTVLENPRAIRVPRPLSF